MKPSPAERKYAAVEREVLAIKWAIKELRYYLAGQHFTLVTYHAPLQWMAEAKDSNTRVTQWFLSLQDWQEPSMGMQTASRGDSHCGPNNQWQ